MPDKQIHPTGTVHAPADYTLSSGSEILLKSVYAKYDGSGASGSFVPLVRIISNAGSITDEVPQDATIAAGASADATWFPRVGASASAAPTGTVSWVHLHDPFGSVVSRSTPHTIYDFTSSIVYTNDSSLFSVVPGNGLRIAQAGFYTVAVSCIFTGQLAAGSAEAILNLSGIGNEIDSTDTFMKPDFAGGIAICTMTESFPLDSSGSTAPLSLLQTSGVTATVGIEVSVIRTTSDQGDF